MKASNVISIIAMTLFASAAIAEEPTAQPQLLSVQTEPLFVPIIGFMEPRFDFGALTAGDEIQHEFQFLNNGGDALIIENAMSGVSGVAVGVSSAPVLPGEFGKVWVRVNTADMSGEQFIRIKLKSNASNGSSVLYMSGTVDG